MTKKIAVLFPGQGSQFVGMGREFAEADQEAMAIMEMAESMSGAPLKKLSFEGPMEELTLAVNLQPALTAANLICWQAVKKAGIRADYFAGHSLGEYCALHAAGVLGQEDTFKLVAARGRIMGQAGEKNPGGMVAILGLPLDRVQEILDGLASPDRISVGNHNSAQQAVISGESGLLAAASDLAVEKGGRAIPLNVSIANHSPLMNSAVADFEKTLATVELAVPATPVFFNVTAAVEEEAQAIRSIMARQIISTVRWFEIINQLLARDVDTFIEVGPKKVLSGLMKRILPRKGGQRCYQADTPATLEKCLAEIA